MPSTSPPPSDLLAALADRAAGGVADRAAAPVEAWHPPDCGPVDLAIDADGTWRHDGRPILRPALVRLFARVLRRDADGTTWLVTPAEKCRVRVADVAFVAVDLAVDGDGPARRLAFRTNVGDLVVAGPAHPLRFAVDAATGGVRPYLRVRGGLEARATRAVALDLLGHVEPEDGPDGVGRPGLRSDGAFFPLPDAATETGP
jgi:hypothetical protein